MNPEYAVRSPVHEQVCVVDTGLAENAHHTRRRCVHPSSNVQRFERELGRIGPDHFTKPFSHSAHSRAADASHSTITVVTPQRTSIRIRASLGRGFSSATGTNCCASIGGLGSAFGCALRCGDSAARSASTTQRRSRFAFTDRDIAAAAIDTPGWQQAATASALNSALCRRRRRRSKTVVFTCRLQF